MNDLPTHKSDSDHVDFPEAKVVERPARWKQIFAGSKMWWATLACLVVAGALVWRSIEETGPTILIQFSEGHGLTVGDSVRHRGIDVGHVDRVDLNEYLSAIEVEVTLLPGAKALAREGTQFWIVRPRLSLSGVSGLETAIGPKYIAVLPADTAAEAVYEFVGLPAAPPGNLDDRGMEIILRSGDSYGLRPSAPILWRGVTVGEILSIDIASDTRFIDIRARIDSHYARLVRRNSKFWVTSGIGIDAGLMGLKVKAESLATIARGGVSFITPTGEGKATPIAAGHVFALSDKKNDDWVDASSSVSFIDFPLPPTVTVRASWNVKQFGFTREREASVGGLVIARDPPTRITLLAPVAGLMKPDAALDGSWSVEVRDAESKRLLFTVPTSIDRFQPRDGLTLCRLSVEEKVASSIPASRLRTPTLPEDCCLVRSVASDSGPPWVIQSISRLQLTPGGAGWRVEAEGSDLDDWHGAVVVANSDGDVIGMFLTADEGPTIATFDAELLAE